LRAGSFLKASPRFWVKMSEKILKKAHTRPRECTCEFEFSHDHILEFYVVCPLHDHFFSRYKDLLRRVFLYGYDLGKGKY